MYLTTENRKNLAATISELANVAAAKDIDLAVMVIEECSAKLNLKTSDFPHYAELKETVRRMDSRAY